MNITNTDNNAIRGAQCASAKNKAVEKISGWRVAHSGGNANNGAQAGFATLNANNSASNRNTNTGAHVCKHTSFSSALPLGKTQNNPLQGVGNYLRVVKAPGQKQTS